MTRPATLPSPWDIAFAAWKTARLREDAYDRDVWMPAYDVDPRAIPASVEADMERLQGLREALEVPLFALPATNAHQLALKCLMAFDNGRECTGWLSAILSDCCRFADDTLTRGHLSDDRVVSQHHPAGHRDWLAERNAMYERVSAADESTDFDDHSLNSLEAMIFDTPARTADDVIAKLVFIAQSHVEGFEPSAEAAAAVVVEARAHFGLGSIPSGPPAAKGDAA